MISISYLSFMFRFIALTLGMILTVGSMTPPSYATLSAVSGEIQIRSKVDPDTIKIRALEKKIKVQKMLIATTETSIKYVE